VWTPRGLSVLAGSTLFFLLLTYYLNGQPNIIDAYNTTASSFFIPHYGLILTLSVLFGITITIFQHNLSTASLAEQGTTGAFTMITALISGCAGCAAGLLPGILAFLGIGGSLLSLPFLGLELLVASVAVYAGLIYYLLSPSQCSLPDA
jgi:hypothetical protein